MGSGRESGHPAIAMGGRGILALLAILLFLAICQLPTSEAAKRRYFKFGGMKFFNVFSKSRRFNDLVPSAPAAEAYAHCFAMTKRDGV